MMTIYIIEIHMGCTDSQKHEETVEHIEKLRYEDTDSKVVQEWPRFTAFIEILCGTKVWVRNGNGYISVEAVRKDPIDKSYVRTVADNTKKDNLLSLPRY